MSQTILKLIIPYFNYSFYMQYLSKAFYNKLKPFYEDNVTTGVFKLHMELGGSPHNIVLCIWNRQPVGHRIWLDKK
jgi:hypothetical protein